MKCKKMIFALILWPLVILMISILVSCGSLSFTYKGLTVPEKNLIYLKNKGSHEGKWQTVDISVTYLYTRSADILKISGLIDFDDSLKFNYSHLNDFDFRIYFVNSKNIITGNIRIYFYTAFNEIEAAPFEKNGELPADTQAIVFGYSGRVSGDGGQDSFGNSWRFGKTPHG